MEPAYSVMWRRCLRERLSMSLAWRRVSACQFSVLSQCIFSAVCQRSPSARSSVMPMCTSSRYSALCQLTTSFMSSTLHQRCPIPLTCVMPRFSTPSTITRSLCVTSQPLLCWSCQAVISRSQLFCPSCNSLQPLDEAKDYFQILDCDRSFNIDTQELQNKYRNLQRYLHPDYYSQKSQHEQLISEKHSSLVNKAYNTLLSPLSRGIYLLSLHGIKFTEGTEDGADSPFLLEILEINEKLNETISDAEIEEIGIFLQDKSKSLTKHIGDAFQKGDLKGAKMFLAKLKYYSNILEQVKKKIIP